LIGFQLLLHLANNQMARISAKIMLRWGSWSALHEVIVRIKKPADTKGILVVGN